MVSDYLGVSNQYWQTHDHVHKNSLPICLTASAAKLAPWSVNQPTVSGLIILGLFFFLYRTIIKKLQCFRFSLAFQSVVHAGA